MIIINKVVLIGRLTRNPEVRWSTGDNPQAVARYTLAVDRRFKKDGQQDADFISCIAFGRNGEFADKYLKQGTKIAVEGNIRTGSYTNRDGKKVYTTDVVVDNHEFVESKKQDSKQEQKAPKPDDNDFMEIPDGIEDDLPFIG